MSTIFYAWQSDLRREYNLDLVEQALEHAAEKLREDPAVDWDPTVDRDTKGIPGSPDVPGSIFEKIDAADACVFDVSIGVRAERPCPNPNVMVELGYALKAHPLDRLLLVFNEVFGRPRELPFDLGYKRLILYSAGPEADLDAARASLATELLDKLREVSLLTKPVAHEPDVDRLRAKLHDKFSEMLSSRGGVFLWADRDATSGYVVLTEQNKKNLVPPRDLRAVVRYDPGLFRLTPSAFPEEVAALEQLASKRGMKLLPPIE